MSSTDIIKAKRVPKQEIKYKITLTEEQKEAKRIIYNNKVTALWGVAGTSKAQPLECKIYTEDGYILMGDIKVGDKVLTKNGTTVVNGVYPQGIKDVYKVSFKDGTSTECCEDHLWSVAETSDRDKIKYSKLNNNLIDYNDLVEFKTISLSNMLKRGIFQGIKIPRSRYIVPNLKSHFDNKQDFIIHPYIMGILIGDGSIRTSVTFTSIDDEIVNNIKNLLPDYMKCNYLSKKRKNGSRYFYSITDERGYREKNSSFGGSKINKFSEELRKYGLFGKYSHNKFIPDDYKYSSISNRLSLIQGIMDADGTVAKKDGSITIGLSCKRLIDDVAFILRSLGCIVRYRTPYFPKSLKQGDTIISKHLSYNISISPPSDINLFRLSRKQNLVRERKIYAPIKQISGVEKIGQKECQCISVEDDSHLYFTDDLIVTHNTMVATHSSLDMFFKKEVEKIYILRPAVAMEDLGYQKGSLQEKLQYYFVPIMHNLYQNYDKVKIDKMVEQGDIEIVALAFIQGMTIHNSILICDEAENITERQMRMILTRLGKGSKIVFTGDIDQIMLKDVKSSGFKKLIDLEGYLNGFASFELKQNYRDEFVQEILKLY